MPRSSIKLRGVAVHNLKHIDLDIPHRRLVVVCGLSGSGKTSLAIDTLYAEGQRRYIDSFSAYTRQFFDRLEKPAADLIEGIGPSIAITHKNTSRSSRSTVGTATETSDYLRLLFAKVGEVVCLTCGRPVRRQTPQSAAESLAQLPEGTRFLIGFSLQPEDEHDLGDASEPARDAPSSGLRPPSPIRPSSSQAGGRRVSATLRQEGIVRAVVNGRLISVADAPDGEGAADTGVGETTGSGPVLAVIDRLSAGAASLQRLRDSLESAFAKGGGQAMVLVEAETAAAIEPLAGVPFVLEGRTWQQVVFSAQLKCGTCGREYPEPDPRQFSFNSPLGACPTCDGFGNVMEVDLELAIPDQRKTIREGAVAPWNTPAFKHELEELQALAKRRGLPLDVPYSELTAEQKRLVIEGSPPDKFGGLNGFFAWLERRKYKMHYRVLLSRFRSQRLCPTCHGTRLREEGLAVRIGGLNIAELSALKVRTAIEFFDRLELDPWRKTIGRVMLDAVRARLGYLDRVDLGYLALDRTLRTLSGGESQRVALTSALGSSLVNMLYVLDEPSVGLHPQDVGRLLKALTALRDRGNSVIVVEHEELVLRAADQIIEIGPGAGERGGQVVFQGTVDEMLAAPRSLTGDFLAGRRGLAVKSKRRMPNHGWIRLSGARGNNLQNVTVELPLGMLCLVTGVSGSGKSTLVADTLYPALCRRMRKDAPRPLEHDDVFGDGQLDDVVMVDQSPIGRSPRSNPVTYIKAFDEIRQVFAETVDAKTRNYDASFFSFNVDGGRCTTCQGDGHLQVDMQFLADVYMKCPQCGGTRYRREILDVQYRGLNISQVLELTVREAFTFFRGRTKVQARLKKLIDVGLDYLRLGQPANTLSGGESQRLKLAAYMSATRRGRSLLILDEPTTGLHFQDIVQLLDCFDALLAIGHSLVVIEHNLQVMQAADYIIDLGPGAADEGGRVVAHGTPEAVARAADSATAPYLATGLAEHVQERSA